MNAYTPVIKLLEYLDSVQRAEKNRQELDIQRHEAQLLGLSAVEAAKAGFYTVWQADRYWALCCSCLLWKAKYLSTNRLTSQQPHTIFRNLRSSQQ